MTTISKQHFVFFANASPTIGAGHIMRLLALAQACVARGLDVSFASYECPDFLCQKLTQEGFNLITLATDFTTKHVQAFKATVIVIDDYSLSDKQWSYFEKTKALLVNIDDETNTKSLNSDIIINPAAGATQASYLKRAPQASYLLGVEYSLLRHEFVQQTFIEIDQRNRILITLGGADVKNMSLALTLALLRKELDGAEIYVLLGGLNALALVPLQALANQHNNLFVIEKSERVAELMMHSGLAITAAGGTLAELACMGTPSIALVSVDNQKAAMRSEHVNTWFLAHDVRSFKEEASSQDDMNHNAQMIEEIADQADKLWRDLCRRKLMSTHARQLIDGHGCDRIIEHILLSLRP